ncbi:MAG: hypothetical protein HQ555_02360 [Candidatus Aminicenantes bacterium]|nr:hypothetical protein [Candidatus Aminicenantes bacterium]
MNVLLRRPEAGVTQLPVSKRTLYHLIGDTVGGEEILIRRAYAGRYTQCLRYNPILYMKINE